MADVVNLNRFRKRRERDARAESAAHNRVTHGRSAVEREASAELRRREEDELAELVPEIVIHAGRLDATPATLELEALQLDLHRLEPAGDDTAS